LYFIDTCILIDYLKGSIALDEQNKQQYCINSIVEMEVYVGALNKKELQVINKRLSGFTCVSIDQDILNLATDIVIKYSLSHIASIYDSIIAATCLIYDLPLWTHNKKDFKFLDDILLVDKEL